MPDKQNENKFMSMLERRGIVRKADSEEAAPQVEPVDIKARPEVDLRSLFGTSAEDSPKVTPAARQPIPGMSTPILPSERRAQAEQEKPQSVGEPSKLERPKTGLSPEVEKPQPPQPYVTSPDDKPPEPKEPPAPTRASQEPVMERFPRESLEPVMERLPRERSNPFAERV